MPARSPLGASPTAGLANERGSFEVHGSRGCIRAPRVRPGVQKSRQQAGNLICHATEQERAIPGGPQGGLPGRTAALGPQRYSAVLRSGIRRALGAPWHGTGWRSRRGTATHGTRTRKKHEIAVPLAPGQTALTAEDSLRAGRDAEETYSAPEPTRRPTGRRAWEQDVLGLRPGSTTYSACDPTVDNATATT